MPWSDKQTGSLLISRPRPDVDSTESAAADFRPARTSWSRRLRSSRSWSAPGKPLKDLVREISPRPLLLIAGGRGANGPGGGEFGLARMYAEAAGEPVEYRGLPEGRHTVAIRERPDEYERRVVSFFDDPLRRGSA